MVWVNTTRKVPEYSHGGMCHVHVRIPQSIFFFSPVGFVYIRMSNLKMDRAALWGGPLGIPGHCTRLLHFQVLLRFCIVSLLLPFVD